MDKFIRDVMKGDITREMPKERPHRERSHRERMREVEFTVRTYDVGSSGQNQRQR